MAALILVLGAASALTQVTLNALRNRLIDVDVAQLRAIGDIQASIAESHLWMEEFVTGDTTAHAEIWAGIDRARALTRALLDGDAREESAFAIRPVADADLRAGIGILAAEVDHFSRIAAKRDADYRSGASVGVGSAADAEYDGAFHALLTHAQALRAQIERRMAVNIDFARWLSRAILAAWFVLVVFAYVGFALLERRRAAVEHALRMSELQLAQAHKLEAVGRMASGLAHDINNYLAAITAQSELVKRKPPDAGDAAAVERLLARMDDVIATANRASALIGRLLTFGRRTATRPDAVAFDRVIGDLVPLMRQLVGDRIDLDVRIADESWNVSVDAGEIEQIVVNLLVNAREAMPAGGRVRVETRNVHLDADDIAQFRVPALPGDYVMLVVADDGVGMTTAVQARLFEPFFSTKPRTSNSGLGLATLYGIVKQSLGSIAVESEPGVGTTFRVCLPRSFEPVTPVADVAESPSATGGAEHVLLIEDNAELRVAIVALLESLGYRIMAARDGEDAVRIAERDDVRIDVVVTDVVMPGIDGAEAYARIVARRGPRPVLFISAHDDRERVTVGTGAAAQRYLRKPFPLESLAREIRSLLDESGAGAGHTSP